MKRAMLWDWEQVKGMKKLQFLVKNAMGIHARPAAMLSSAARQHQSEIWLKCGERSADAKDLMELLNLDAVCGDIVTAEISGPDEEAACEAVKTLLQDKSGEDFQLTGS